MQIDWAQRWISIPYQGTTAVLIGDAPDLPVGSVIQLSLISDTTQSANFATVCPAIQGLLSEFA
jgi:hypothetical protein